MKNRIWGRKLLAAVLAAALMFSMTACQGSEESAKEESGGSRGRYVERALAFSEGEILASQGQRDGTLRVITDRGVYDSTDQGESFKAWENMPGDMQAGFDESVVYSHKAISREGDIFYESPEGLRLATADGRILPIKIDLPVMDQPEDATAMTVSALDKIDDAVFTDTGELLIAYRDKVYQIDAKSLETKHVYEELTEGPASSDVIAMEHLFTVGGRFYVMSTVMDQQENEAMTRTGVSVEAYDLSDFQSEGRQEVLENFFMTEGASWDNFLALPGEDEKSLYFVSQEGIYRWQTEGTAMEKIFTGSMGQMNNPFAYLTGGTVFGEGELLLYYYADRQNSVYKYFYDPEAAVQPEKTLTVYSLYDSPSVIQAITAFQAARTDVQINFEVGVTGEDAVTRTDALKVLNTNIMAGEGPDILMLEGMPVEAYCEKGLLQDMGDLVEEISNTDGIFENVAGVYRKDGVLGAVPTHFCVPVVLGSQSLVDRAGNLEELANVVEEQRQERPEARNILGYLPASLILRSLMPAASPGWMKKDGTMDGEKLTEFFDTVKRIVDAQGITEDFVDMEQIPENQCVDMTQFMTTVEYTAVEMGYWDARISVGNLGTNIDLCNLVSKVRDMGAGSYRIAAGQGENVFIPMNPVGISAKSEETEIARDFVHYLLTEGQTIQGISGWPVNKASFGKTMEKPGYYPTGLLTLENDMGGSSYELERIWPSKEDFQELEGRMEELTIPAVTDKIINRAVIQEGMKFLKGEGSASDAADAVLAQVNLYLSE